MATATRITAEDFLERHSDTHVELIDGELVVTSPSLWHQTLALRIAVALDSWTRERGRRTGVVHEFDARLSDHDVFKPDVAWYGTPHDPKSTYPGMMLPDLAVEVRSPSTWRHDIGRKKRLYEERGIAELWLVDHLVEVVLVFRRSAPGATAYDVELELETTEVLASPLLPGFALSLAELFGD